MQPNGVIYNLICNIMKISVHGAANVLQLMTADLQPTSHDISTFKAGRGLRGLEYGPASGARAARAQCAQRSIPHFSWWLKT